jgi:hypothetical protein
MGIPMVPDRSLTTVERKGAGLSMTSKCKKKTAGLRAPPLSSVVVDA